MKQKITLVLVIIGLTFTLGVRCTQEFPEKEQECDPNDQGGTKMKAEYDYQVGYEIGWMEGLYDNVQGAFEFAGTDITICSIQGEPPFFPDDPQFFTADGFLRYERLESFYYAHKSSGLVYYLASADGVDLNHPRGSLVYWGVTREYPSPNVPPNPKWSFIFVGDIPEEDYGDRLTKHRHVTYATIHELGHQRAGLTHPEEYDEYHHPTYPCIMHTHYNVTIEVLRRMRFCYNTTSGDNCKYFLGLQNQK